MRDEDIQANLAFLKEAERLKDVLRSSHTSSGRHESTAEHTWRLCLWVLIFAEAFDGIDVQRLMKMCLVHDLGEAIGGDIPAIVQTDTEDKAVQERLDLQTLIEPLPVGTRTEILKLWDEYEAAATPEARMAKGLDKLETILQHNQGKNPGDFDYLFNLDYGAKHTATHPLLIRLRAILDSETEARDSEQRGLGTRG